MAFIDLADDAPTSHRVAHRLARGGYRGNLHAWRLAQRIRPLPGHATVVVGGQPMPLDLADKTTSINLYRGFYERAELAMLQRFVHVGDSCVDVGANAGLYTLAMRVLAGSDGRVVAFEPNPVMATKVRALVAATRGAAVEVLELALSDEEGRARLHLFEGDSGYATLRDWDVDGTSTVEVPVRRLDEVPEVGSLGEIAFLKVDVESWEAHVLAGASGLMGSGRVRVALMELPTDSSAPRMAEAVDTLTGYRAFHVSLERTRLRSRTVLRAISARDIAAGGLVWSNMLLVRRDVMPEAAGLVGS